MYYSIQIVTASAEATDKAYVTWVQMQVLKDKSMTLAKLPRASLE